MYVILLQPVRLQAFCTEELCNEIKAQTNTPGCGSPGWMVLLKKKLKQKALNGQTARYLLLKSRAIRQEQCVVTLMQPHFSAFWHSSPSLNF